MPSIVAIRRWLRPALPCLAMGLGAVISGSAQDAPPAESEQNLVIHGYLSQAFAISDGFQVLGIPKDGTFDYRTAALQFRATVSPRDSFVIQFSQERLGESPFMAVRNQIELDWIFYKRDLGAATGLGGTGQGPLRDLQASQQHLELDLAGFDEQLSRDYAAGLSYAFRRDLVVKVENHWAGGRNFRGARSDDLRAAARSQVPDRQSLDAVLTRIR